MAAFGVRRRWLLLAVALLLALGSLIGVGAVMRGPAEDPGSGVVEIGGPFRLTDQHGQRVAAKDFQGQWMLVYFGYTFCPDVCPITLARMKRLYGALGEERAERVAVVFVSVDPERDSLAKMAEYVPGFDPRFYGVRAEGDELAAAKSAFGVSARNVEPGAGRDAGFYFVDHTGSMFLLDDERRTRVIHPFEADLADVVADVRTLLTEAA